MLERFGKSFLDVMPFKMSFFEDNERLLKRVLETATEYNRQPKRTKCKNCAEYFCGDEPSFEKHGIKYIFCHKCGHCCGDREESDEFLNFLYAKDDGKKYAEVYSEKERDVYWKRVHSIYAPKAEFLFDVLEYYGEDPRVLTYGDLGAGSGYFIAALKEKRIDSAIGYDISFSQAELAKQMIDCEAVIALDRIDEIVDICAVTKASVVSMIGFIEHVHYPHEIMKSLVSNTCVKFLLITFPLFSCTVFFERIFEAVMPRHLAGGHTHLYTLQSLDWFEKTYSLVPIGKWWFGTDAMDLFRSITIELNKRKENHLSHLFANMFRNCIDDIQNAIDMKLACSSVHAVYRINRF